MKKRYIQFRVSGAKVSINQIPSAELGAVYEVGDDDFREMIKQPRSEWAPKPDWVPLTVDQRPTASRSRKVPRGLLIQSIYLFVGIVLGAALTILIKWAENCS